MVRTLEKTESFHATLPMAMEEDPPPQGVAVFIPGNQYDIETKSPIRAPTVIEVHVDGRKSRSRESEGEPGWVPATTTPLLRAMM